MRDQLPRTKRCPHIHVSGRRCAGRFAVRDLITRKSLTACDVHTKSPDCSECKAMMATFAPRKGWG